MKTHLVERLRIKAGMIELGEKIPYGSDSGVMLAAADEIERLRKALQTIADGDVPREHVVIYRSDGVHSKHDKCKHGAWMYDGCEDCVTEYARAALGEGKE